MIQHLAPNLRSTLEKAAALAVRNANKSIEIEHFVYTMCETPEIAEALEKAGCDAPTAIKEAQLAIASLPRGHGSAPSMSQNIVTLAREAWLTASLRFGHGQITDETLLLTLGTESDLRSALRVAAPSLLKMNLAALEDAAREALPQPEPGAAPTAQPAPSATGGEDFLAAYATDLTADAKAGRIDSVIGRDAELRQMIDILMRRRQNNPILVGEAGVGKTAVAEAFALMIAEGEAPDRLKDVSLMALDLSLLQAGAGVKGEFERRLTGVVDQVKASPKPIILFIDEAHTLIGAGAQSGQGDAANILKPALARGDLRTIAATTWSEYKKYFEKDPALTRRFQTVKVDEPDIETAVRMMRKIAPRFKDHHNVRIRDRALRAAVELSARYIPERQLPDKAVSLIDTAAAAVTLSRQTQPAALQDLRREVELLDSEIAALQAELLDDDAKARLESLQKDLAAAQSEAAVLEDRLQQETKLVTEADEIEDSLSKDGENFLRLTQAEKALHDVQGESPLIHRVVDDEAISAVVARWTGVPTGRLMRDEITAVSSLSDRLKTRVLGQNGAIDKLSEAMRVSRAGLTDERKPTGVFLLVGTSGVGKTETALGLADELYGGPAGLTVINMSEYKEEHKVSLLMGSPPGYVGYGEGGVLTEAVRRRPYGVLLLDEMDKAHPSVQDIFYQVFDKGTLRDGEGRDVDFRNTTIIMTANTGTETLATLAEDPDTMPEGRALEKALKPELLETFKPAFLGRVAILPYIPLTKDVLGGIVDIQLGKIADRTKVTYGTDLTISDKARSYIVENAAAGDTGARAIETMLSQDLLPKVADYFLESLISGGVPKMVVLDIDADSDFVLEAETPHRNKAT
nr:type VI secretion system ATPase TssH [Pseudaestuariivita rosea]